MEPQLYELKNIIAYLEREIEKQQAKMEINKEIIVEEL